MYVPEHLQSDPIQNDDNQHFVGSKQKLLSNNWEHCADWLSLLLLGLRDSRVTRMDERPEARNRFIQFGRTCERIAKCRLRKVTIWDWENDGRF